MIRVLHIVTYMGRGGIETMLMNYYRNIDRNVIQFDFLVHRQFEADYDEEIKELGGNIYRLPNLNPFSLTYLRELDEFFEEHDEYSIVHSHLDCMSSLPLKYAKKHGVPVRIAHSHSSNLIRDKKYLLKQVYKRQIPRYANKLFACGDGAGKWMFGNYKYTVLNNAIDAKKYSYNFDTRNQMRKELDIPQNAFVIGHVGLFREEKNHLFILKIFKQLLELLPDSYLLLVGDGELRKNIEDYTRNNRLSDRVILTGLRSDVPDLLQAMDIFLFPSLYEGLSLSTVEAQASGLPCLLSDTIPKECIKTDLVRQISLSESIDTWVDTILQMKDVKRRDTYLEISNAGFDIVNNAATLQKFYENAYKKKVSAKKKVRQEFENEYRNDILLTVFTPAYNRAHTLTRTYESLRRQKCKKFIWLIINDGSSDNTEELVRAWQASEQDFEIRYIFKENGGMHTAHNVAYDNIDTLLNVCIDSDDCLADNAIEIILDKWKEIENQNYAGMIGLDADLDGNIIGTGFSEDLLETTLFGYYKQGGRGDKKLVYRTDVIKKYPPYPVFEGERYVALAYKYRLIDQEYKLAVIDKVLCNVEYQPDGSSGTMWKQYLKNPKGFAFWRKVCMKYPESNKRLWIDCIHYVSNSIIARDKSFLFNSPKKIRTIISIPFGLVLAVMTYIKGK